jgi:endonuclease YncB( thermonuclease family)
VGGSDSDTMTVLDAEQVTHKVRLSAIDAPEKAQQFCERAKPQLSNWHIMHLGSTGRSN